MDVTIKGDILNALFGIFFFLFLELLVFFETGSHVTLDGLELCIANDDFAFLILLLKLQAGITYMVYHACL